MATNQEIGRRMEARRNERGLTLEQVAAQVGVAKSTIQRYERGQIGRLKRPVVESIAEALGVTAAYLLGETEDKAAPAEAELKAALWGGDRDLSPEDIDELWADVREYAAFKAQQHKARKRE